MAEPQNPPYEAKQVANWFLVKARSSGASLSPMQLQKLIFFAVGEAKANGIDLINQKFHAWQYGPVEPSVYHEFKDFGGGAITTFASRWDDSASKFVHFEEPVDSISVPILENIWKVFGEKDGPMLSRITHLAGTPWAKCVEKAGGEEKLKFKTVPIDGDDLREYFNGDQWSKIKSLMMKQH
ncbi:MAG TPA: type II toxin-antitoxin system antitoxin SocA domain-containing protein [Oligoflexus sp.]|uniref:Panacea domain-containing protein n=1 Tax=Oligoflexus sp. TaxID=1971216 RepID=UPI002D7F74EA|nr:type II toxin-antitoxin system antitoxin SocA domain-containing protein [Oligoflexus sp.]HET9236216.1 type II toxin-antitoxin system antitoxin SocA domain-containing protein [Oligoflexus sp.]